MAALRYICFVGLIALAADITLSRNAAALLAPVCNVNGKWLDEGTPCGRPSLHMTCQQQGQGDRKVCRKAK